MSKQSWENTKLADLGKIVTGQTPKTKVDEYYDGDYMIVRPSDIDYDHYKCWKTEKTVTERAKREYENRFIPAKSVMYTCIASVGKCAISTAPCITNQQINSIVVNGQNDYRFVYYLLRHSTPYIKKQAGGTATAIINKTDFSNIELSVPPPNEQKRIADILSAFDDLIEVNCQRIERLERAARLLYREWFVHHRFPGHEHTEIVDGVPEDWQNCLLTDLFDFRNGKAPDKSEEGRYPVFGSNGKIGFSKEYRHERALIIGRVGVCGSVNLGVNKFWASDNTIVAMPKNEGEIYFLYHLLSHYPLERLAGGTAQPLLTQRILKTVEVPVPSKSLRKQFEEAVAPMMQMASTVTRQNKKLKQARDILLPRLMSGEITV